MHCHNLLSPDNPSGSITVRHIFDDNDNWARYRFHHGDNLRSVEVREVDRMLHCHDDGRGFFVYQCPHCNEFWVVSNGCNSRICSECGKRHTDKWAKNLSSRLFNVPHRHLVLSVSDIVWNILRENRSLEKTFMNAGIKAINATLSHSTKKVIRLGGAIVVLHPFGKDMEYRPHLHVIMIEGGFDKYNKFVHKKFIPYGAMRKTWQYHLLTMLKAALPSTEKYRRLIDACFKKYPKGFYIHMPPESRINNIHHVGKYVGRYIRHPAIANSRISAYDGTSVTFWFYKDPVGKTDKHFITLPVEEFIRRIIQHIPEKHFKMIRYYGAYCRKWKRKYKRYLLQGSITQSKMSQFPRKRVYRCPKCHCKLDFDFKIDRPPPEDRHLGEFVEDWAKISWNPVSCR